MGAARPVSVYAVDDRRRCLYVKKPFLHRQKLASRGTRSLTLGKYPLADHTPTFNDPITFNPTTQKVEGEGDPTPALRPALSVDSLS